MHEATLRQWGYDGSGLEIDTATGALVGAWAAIPGEAHPHLDFLTPAELCNCCGRVLLISGSKFSIWLCDECRVRVRDLNSAVGRCVIPVGRHTLLNGVGTGTTPVRDWQDGDVERFVNDARGLFASMDVLDRWADEIVRRNCVEIGLDAHPTVALAVYLRAVLGNGVPKTEAFTQMLDWWAEQ